MNGPCICGDPRCPRCGNPFFAWCCDAEEEQHRSPHVAGEQIRDVLVQLADIEAETREALLMYLSRMVSEAEAERAIAYEEQRQERDR